MKIDVIKVNKPIKMRDIPANTFAVIVESGYAGTVVFRPWVPEGSINNQFIALMQNSPGEKISSFSDECSLMVEILTEGSSFKVTV